MTKQWLACTLGLAIVTSLVLGTNGTQAQKKGKTRPLTSSQMMAGLVKPEFLKLKEGLEKGPKTDDDWKALAQSAALLNECSYILMDDGRCPDKPWKEGSEILRTASVKVLSLIDKKDAAGALEAFPAIQQSCKVCHTEHKYKKK